MPKVSVVISAFNHEEYISQSIKSILNQSFRDFELIVVDNGSTDSTYKMILSVMDPRIRIFSIEKNVGFGYALNYCLKKSRGKYISLFTSDDLCSSDKLEKQVKYLDTHPEIGAVFSQAEMIDEERNRLEKHYYDGVFNQKNRNRHQWLNYFFYHGNCLCFPSALIRKSVYGRIGIENERLAQLHDFDLWIRLCLKYDIHIINEKLIEFRIRKDNKNAGADTIENRVRSMFEFSHALKHYLKIKNTGEFLKIFPEAKNRHDDINDKELIPFYVAREALDVEHVFHQKFALDTIFGLLHDKKAVEKLKNVCHFDYSDFIKLTGQYDLYHVDQIARLDDSVKKLKEEYEKLRHPIKEFKKSIWQKSA